MSVILNEVCATRFSLLESASSEPGVLATVRGTFAEYNKRNKNGRTYSKDVWDRALNDSEVLAALKGKRMYCELDHPNDYLDIKIEKTAACVTDLSIDEATNTVRGELKVLDTPAGNILNTLIRFGSVLGVSSRAAGDLDESGNVIPESYDFITFDVVTNPSNEGALPTLVESTNYVKNPMDKALIECIKTADTHQLGIIKTIAETMDQEMAEPVIDKIADRESELQSNDSKEDQIEEINRKLDLILDLLSNKVAGGPEDSTEIVEPEIPENQVREAVRVKVKPKMTESSQRETSKIPVSHVSMESGDESTIRCAHLIQTIRSK